MEKLQVVGEQDPSINYVDRPTVKVIVQNSDDRILIINDGLLPGGGVEDDEDNPSALKRELLEELGMEVTNLKEIGIVTQYRDLIKRKYTVYGYSSIYRARVANPTPQNDREAQISYDWYSIQDAQRLLQSSIDRARGDVEKLKNSDTEAKLFNLITTKVFLDSFAGHH